jgi:hypothetical protein
VWVSVRRLRLPAKKNVPKGPRDSHDTILNVISANRDRVIPAPPGLGAKFIKRTHAHAPCQIPVMFRVTVFEVWTVGRT